MEKYEILCFIPARGGSERIPRKNIKIMAGKPMIAWTIEASLKSKYITRTFVSTEDKEIKKVALKYGAEVIDRPAELSKGQIIGNFAYHLLQYFLWREKYEPDYIIFLIATSPLRTAKHIDEAFELYFKSESPLLMSVTKAWRTPHNKYFINESGKLEHLFKESTLRDFTKDYKKDHINQPIIYNDDSAIYIGPYKGTNSYTFGFIGSGNIIPYIMETQDTIDVDTPLDFKVAEMLMKERIKKERGLRC